MPRLISSSATVHATILALTATTRSSPVIASARSLSRRRVVRFPTMDREGDRESLIHSQISPTDSMKTRVKLLFALSVFQSSSISRGGLTAPRAPAAAMKTLDQVKVHKLSLLA